MPVVAVPGQGNVSFPDSMSDEDIEKVIRQHSIPPNPSDTIPKANPTPKELQGPAPSKIRQLIQNIPGSAISAIKNGAQMAGAAPGSADTYDPNYKDPLIEGAKNLYHKVTSAGNLPKVGETEANGDTVAGEGFPRLAVLGNALRDQVVEDPVNSALALASSGENLAHGPVGPVLKGAAKGAFEEATKTTPINLRGHVINAPNIMGGAAAGELAGWPLGHPGIGAGVGAAATVAKGAIEGGKGALDAYRQLQLKGMVGEPLWKQSGTNDIAPVDDPTAPPPVTQPPVQGPIPQPTLPSGRTPGPVTPQPQAPPPTQVRPLPTPTQNQPLPPKSGPMPTPGPRKPPTPDQIRQIVDTNKPPELNEDMLSKLYDEYGNAKKEELVGHAKAKDENIASELGAAGVTKKVWENADQAQRTALVKNIKFPEGHLYAGKSQHRGAPEEDWRVAYIGSKLPD